MHAMTYEMTSRNIVDLHHNVGNVSSDGVNETISFIN
jgi:hypothetical protein